MKKIIVLIVLLSLLSEASVVYAIQGDCLDGDGKFSDCNVYTNEGKLFVEFSSTKWKKLNKEIVGNKITALSKGEYARRRVGESVGLAFVNPLFLFMLFSKKKRDTYGIEYAIDKNTKDAVLVQVKKKYTQAMETILKAVSGKPIIDDTPAKPEQKGSANS